MSMFLFYLSNGSIKNRQIFPFICKSYFSTCPNLTDESIRPPLKKFRDHTSVLRALNSCVGHAVGSLNFNLQNEPGFGRFYKSPGCHLARARGRLAAQMAARDYFPNDIAALAKEIPRVDRWIPLQTPDGILKSLNDGDISNVEAMNKLILLLAPKHAWKLYMELSPDQKWSDETLHELLELQCATNGGLGGPDTHDIFKDYDLSHLPQAEDYYFAHELLVYKTGFSMVDQQNNDGDVIKMDKCLSTTDWSPTSTTAEQLFLKEQTAFCTPRAYCAMIRGASKFGNSVRALELFDRLCHSDHGSQCIDLVTYNALIRSLHHLPSVKSNEQSVWDYVLKVVDVMKTSGQSVDISIYTSILYTMSESIAYATDNFLKNTQSVELLTNVPNLIPQAMGLMDEIESNGLSAELGTYANLLWLLFNTIKIDDKSLALLDTPNSVHFEAYSPVVLVRSIVSEVESKLKNSFITRFDSWGQDYKRFFPICMKIAWYHTDYDLALRLNNLLMQSQNRLFFFNYSYDVNRYMNFFSLLMFYIKVDERRSLDRILACLKSPISFYPSEILSNYLLFNRFVHGCGRFFSMLVDDTKTQQFDVTDFRKEAFEFTSYTAHLILDSHLKLSEEFFHFIELLSNHAWFDRVESFDLFVKLLDVLKNDKNGLFVDELEKLKKQPFINCMMKLTFPTIDEINNGRLKADSDVVELIEKGLEHAYELGFMSWSFTPKVLSFVWAHNDLISTELIWNILEQLSNAEHDQIDTSAATLLAPFLNLMEGSVNNYDDVHRQKTILQKLKNNLSNIA